MQLCGASYCMSVCRGTHIRGQGRRETLFKKLPITAPQTSIGCTTTLHIKHPYLLRDARCVVSPRVTSTTGLITGDPELVSSWFTKIREQGIISVFFTCISAMKVQSMSGRSAVGWRRWKLRKIWNIDPLPGNQVTIRFVNQRWFKAL